MKPRSLTPLCRMPRSSRRSTAWRKLAFETAKATWCTQPGSVGVRCGSPARSSSVKIVMSRPSPGSKYRWLSEALSRLGCSKTKGIPSTPSQKSIEVRRSAPTRVMWWTPWLWSLRMPGTLRPPGQRAGQPGARDQRHAGEDERAAGQRAGRDALAEEDRGPQHAEDRHEERDRQRARRAHLGHEPEVQEVGHGGAGDAE